jgi:hypothetical protein
MLGFKLFLICQKVNNILNSSQQGSLYGVYLVSFAKINLEQNRYNKIYFWHVLEIESHGPKLPGPDALRNN